MVLLFPSLALGETVKFDDLGMLEGLYYKKIKITRFLWWKWSTDDPFTGEVTGKGQGKLKNGVEDGPWVHYHDNGQVKSKGPYKDAECPPRYPK